MNEVTLKRTYLHVHTRGRYNLPDEKKISNHDLNEGMHDLFRL